MTPQQAISILEQATAQLKLTRAEHELVLRAIEILKQQSK